MLAWLSETSLINVYFQLALYRYLLPTGVIKIRVEITGSKIEYFIGLYSFLWSAFWKSTSLNEKWSFTEKLSTKIENLLQISFSLKYNILVIFEYVSFIFRNMQLWAMKRTKTRWMILLVAYNYIPFKILVLKWLTVHWKFFSRG